MTKKQYKYIYGPVPSWRLGSSLGIDPINSKSKACTFSCLYCQLGKAVDYRLERKVFVEISDLEQELATVGKVYIDYITFSGTGEPTLAANLGEMIKMARSMRQEKIAVLTNSSLLYRKDVRQELLLADYVSVKLDASSQNTFKLINRPAPGIEYENILEGIRKFRNEYSGKFALQIMFIEANKNEAAGLAELAAGIGPDEIQINTPLRPCQTKPLGKEEIGDIKSCFCRIVKNNVDVVTVFEGMHKKVAPISSEDTLRRRGKI